MKDKADYTLDVRGAISPFSLLKVSLLFQKMNPQEVVDILGCDREMQRDLLRVLPAGSWEIVSAEPSGKNLDLGRVRLKKREQQTAS